MPLQWEESMVEYNGKHAVYCRLQQEIEGAKTQVKGWQQVSKSPCPMVLILYLHDL